MRTEKKKNDKNVDTPLLLGSEPWTLLRLLLGWEEDVQRRIEGVILVDVDSWIVDEPLEHPLDLWGVNRLLRSSVELLHDVLEHSSSNALALFAEVDEVLLDLLVVEASTSSALARSVLLESLPELVQVDFVTHRDFSPPVRSVKTDHDLIPSI